MIQQDNNCLLTAQVSSLFTTKIFKWKAFKSEAKIPSKRASDSGFDIYTELEISTPQAVLGDEIEVKTIHGTMSAKIPQRWRW